MIKLLEAAIQAKVTELTKKSKKFPNEKICENFLAYIISRLDLDVDKAIAAWLDDNDYWGDSPIVNKDKSND